MTAAARVGRCLLAGVLCALASLLLLPATALAGTAPAAAPANTPLAATAGNAPRIGVVTMAPGEVFFERFGHDAIVVAEPGLEPVSYNFGFFDPAEPDFVGNFARGRMMYWLVALPLSQDLEQYRAAGRGATLQWLNLPPPQARALADSLAARADSPAARYRYDYFQANCATMVRDALDQAMGGHLHAQLSGRSAGNSWRSESVRLARPAAWMWLGFDLLLGPAADQPLSRWEEAFVPMRLADSLRLASNSNGQALVAEEVTLLPHRLPAEPDEAPRRLWPWLLCGIALAAALHASRPRRRLHAGLAATYWLLAGLLGSLMALLWLATEHTAGWANANLWLCPPLALALLPAARAWWRGQRPPAWCRWLGLLLLAGAGLAWLLYGLQTRPQQHLGWIALLLPAHAVLAWQLRAHPTSRSPA